MSNTKPSNYSLWAIRMQIILEANGLWEMIEPNEKTQADNKKDKTAIALWEMQRGTVQDEDDSGKKSYGHHH
nr:zinc finger, CCHC-type [Tanacetum cinerariifolium]